MWCALRRTFATNQTVKKCAFLCTLSWVHAFSSAKNLCCQQTNMHPPLGNIFEDKHPK